MLARPWRASSGPASRNDARMLLASSSSTSVPDVLRVHAHLVLARPLDLGAEVAEQLDHRLDVADPRHVRELHRLVGEQARGEDRQRAVLVAGRAEPPVERAAALDHERLCHWPDDCRGHWGHYASPACRRPAQRPGRRSRATRRARRCCATRSPSRRRRRRTRHGFGEDEELWRVAALLHDFDYEIHPTLDKHPQDGAPILREEGYSDEVIDAILSHANHLSVPRDTPLKRSLFACDELSGFVHACGLVRPTGLDGLEPKSVKKKLKQPSFAAGVSRDDVYEGAELLELDLDEHIANVIAALQPIAGELGLRSEAA